MELAGRVAVITGGASGIGFACARALAAEGARVVLGDVEAPALARAVDELAHGGASVIGEAIDVAREDDLVALREAALRRFGAVHVVMANAGVGGGPVIGTPKAVWDWVMGVNVDGVVNALNAFLPVLLERDEGHVVATASLAGLGGVPGMGPYVASKFAVVGIMESLAHELALRESRVGASVLCPGFVRTRIHESTRNVPAALAGYLEDPALRASADAAAQAVAAGIEPERVAELVTGALREGRFWILPHEHAALRTTEQRLEWMRGGPPPTINLSRATRP